MELNHLDLLVLRALQIGNKIKNKASLLQMPSQAYQKKDLAMTFNQHPEVRSPQFLQKLQHPNHLRKRMTLVGVTLMILLLINMYRQLLNREPLQYLLQAVGQQLQLEAIKVIFLLNSFQEKCLLLLLQCQFSKLQPQLCSLHLIFWMMMMICKVHQETRMEEGEATTFQIL